MCFILELHEMIKASRAVVCLMAFILFCDLGQTGKLMKIGQF